MGYRLSGKRRLLYDIARLKDDYSVYFLSKKCINNQWLIVSFLFHVHFHAFIYISDLNAGSLIYNYKAIFNFNVPHIQ